MWQLRIVSGLVACLLVSMIAAPRIEVAAQTPPSGRFVDSVVLTGLQAPTAVRFSPDGRVFVAEKRGIIRVFDSLSDTTPGIFADLRTNVHNFVDRGLLGLALDPGFPTNPWVYVLYTYDGPIDGPAPRWGTPNTDDDTNCPDPTGKGCIVSGRLSRLRAAGNQMTGSEQVLVNGWFQQFPSHSVGSLAFAPDGALLASGGEGASWQYVDFGQAGNPGGDPPVPAGTNQTAPNAEGGSLRAQDLRTTGDPVGVSGSIIRIDPATGLAWPGNPLFNNSSVNARRIIAYGLRNPFRIAVRPGTQEVWVGDVGWRAWDEINRIADPSAGVVNFGWPCYEGASKQSGWNSANINICEDLYLEPNAVTAPLFQYQQSVAIVSGENCILGNAALSGLAFYQGGSYPAQYNGALFFADYTRGCIWVMPKGANGVPDPAARQTFVTGAAAPVDLQIGPGGDLFYVDIAGGTIHRIVYFNVVAVIDAAPRTGPAPLTVQFDGSRSTGTGLTFDWDLDGNGLFGDANVARPLFTYQTAGTYTARLKVTDQAGGSNTASLAISVGRPPVPTIASPASSFTWAVGQAIAFSGQATDPEDGTLPASALKWTAIIHHCSTPASCHEHVIANFDKVASGSFPAPDHEYPSFLELRLTATDTNGLTGVASVRLDPRHVLQTFQTNPPGLQLVVGTETLTAPKQLPIIVGSTNSISAISPQTLNGIVYTFASWSDGGAQTHNVVAGSSAAPYTATFAAAGSASGEIVRHAARATSIHGSWKVIDDATAASGKRVEHPNAGAPKVAVPAANPADYFEVQFTAEANRAYRLWLRGRAQNDSYTNDSVYVQFTRSVNSSGAPANRIGTQEALAVVIEDCSGCFVAGWGWQDDGYGLNVLGPLVYFDAGPQTIRIQGREDGISIDQIVLSPVKYLNTSPGKTKNDTTILPETNVGPATIVRHAIDAAAPHGTWQLVADPTAADGKRMEHPDAGAPKVATAAANPANYFEVTFTAVAGRPYRLWLRGRAQNDAYANDSVYVQFSGSVTSANAPINRIGTTQAVAVVIEDCSGCGVKGWGWQDNGYGLNVLGPALYFTEGTQTMRIQGREDGISIDQIVLSPDTYLSTPPGAVRNDTTVLPRTP
jgi:glucose/arabinose dehydrogenase/PKD repeat protein